MYRDFPLSSRHPEAQLAAEAAECADGQGRFWKYHDAIFKNHGRLGKELYPELAGRLGLYANKIENILNRIAIRG